MTECLKLGGILNQHCSSGALIGHCCLQLFSVIFPSVRGRDHLLFKDAIVAVYLGFLKPGYLFT